MLPQDPDKLGEQLSAYLDGELSSAEAAEVERVIAFDPQVAAELEALRRTVDAVRALPRRSVPDGLLDDLSGRVERAQLLNGMPEPARTDRRSTWRLLASAAVVVFAVGGGYWVFTEMSKSVSRTERRVALREAEPSLRGPDAPRDAKAPVRGRGKKKAAPAPVEQPPETEFEETLDAYAEPALGVTPRRGVDKSDAPSPDEERGRSADTLAREARQRTIAAEAKPVDEIVRQEPPAAVVAEAAPACNPNASLEAKLRLGVRRSEVLAHQFANEDLNLNVVFANAQDRDQAEDEVNAYMLSNAIQPLEHAVVDDADRVPSSLNFFVKGQAPRNFPETTRDRQTIVRLPAPEFVTLVEAVGASPDRRMELEIGRIVAASDTDRVREVLHRSFAGQVSRRRAERSDWAKDRSSATAHGGGRVAGRAASPSVLRGITTITPKSSVLESGEGPAGQEDADSAGLGGARQGADSTTQPSSDDKRGKGASVEPPADAASEVITVVINLRVPSEATEGEAPTPPAATQPVTTQPAVGSELPEDP